MTLKKAKEYFYQKEYKNALELFAKEKEYYSCGLCSLLLGNIEQAKKYWNKKRRACPGSQWGLSLIGLINLKPLNLPTFFQTRAFLEVYLNLLIENNFIEWAQNLVNCCDELYKSNPESYKFIARALFSNGYFDMAIKFCKKSLRIFYADPEALLILSQCQFLLNDLGEAIDSINRLLKIDDRYFPAKIFQNILKEEVKKRHAN